MGDILAPQRAKKIIFTACPKGKLKLAVTSPNVISASPKSFLMSRIDFTFFCYFRIPQKNITCPSGKLKTELPSPITKSTSPARRTVVHTDHKPLESIFMKPLYRAPKRLQGMLICLQKYDLVVQCERGSRMFLADTLSRAYLSSCAQIESEFEIINMMNYLPISEARLLQI